jgi:putative phage-type endonuclease
MAQLIMTAAEMRDRDAWLKTRNIGIGGSDAGIVAGLSRWKSPFQLWMEKTGQVEPEDISDKEYVYWGTKLEQLVADRFCEVTGKSVRRRGLLKSDRKPFMLASVDRVVVGESAGLECKTANSYASKEWEGDNVPDTYYAQCQHYMAVTGMDKWYIACLLGGNHFVWKEIPRNESDIEALEACEEEFWNHVTDLTAPPLDGSDSCAQALREKFHGGLETPLELDAKAMDLVNQYRRLKEAADDIKDEMETIKNILCGTLGDYETAYAGGIKVSWKTQAGRTTIDSKKLKEEHPDIYEKYSKTGKPTRVFRIA